MGKKATRTEDWADFKWLGTFVKPYTNWVILSVICSTVIGVCEVITVTLIKQLINNTLGGHKEKILAIILLAIVVLTAGIIAKYLVPYCSGRFVTFAIKDLRKKIVLHIDKVQVPVNDKSHSGDIISRLNNDISAVEGFIGKLSNYMYIPLIVVIIFTYLLFINWKLLLFSVIPIPIALFLADRASKPMGQFWGEYFKHFGEANSIIQDVIGGIGILKAFNLEDIFHVKYNERLSKALNIHNKINVRGTLIMPIMFMMYELPYVLCMIYGGYLAVTGNMAAGNLVVFILLLSSLVSPATQLPNIILDTRGIAGAIRRLLELLEQPIERTDGDTFKSDNDSVIEFENVKFNYSENEEVLKNLNFKVKKGENVALVGSSGCGKSTIMNLVCGFYKLNGGSIKLCGKDIEEWNLISLRDQLALVTQDTYLYPGTIEENIRFGSMGSLKDEIVDAAMKANAHDFIIGFPKGYDTEVGERGAMLSGGQRQRIAIARAILKGSPVLLLDEPTSSLDMQSELLVQESLERLAKNNTVLIIAHRLSTIKQVDRILVIDDGHVVESGTHDELLSNGFLYKQLYLKQFVLKDSTVSSYDGREVYNAKDSSSE